MPIPITVTWLSYREYSYSPVCILVVPQSGTAIPREEAAGRGVGRNLLIKSSRCLPDLAFLPRLGSNR